jgi:parvulin-like peptidyl-prolyl isomerase
MAWALVQAWQPGSTLADEPPSPARPEQDNTAPHPQPGSKSPVAPDDPDGAGAVALVGPDPNDEIRSVRPLSPAWEDRTPVALVGPDTVTAGDLYYALDKGKDIRRSAPADSLRRSLLEKVINQRLLAQEGPRRRLDRTSGMSNEIRKIEENMAMAELRRRIYLGKVDVVEDELRELYDRYHYTLRVHHLSVEERELAESLRSRMAAGEEFKDLARRYSKHGSTAEAGGDMGEFGAGHLIIQFEDAVFKIKPGEITPVIKGSGENYKIFRLDSLVKDRQPPPFEELRAVLAERVRDRETSDILYAWQLSMFDKYEYKINEENFQDFTLRLRDKIATWEAIQAVKHDSLSVSWIFTGWNNEELVEELATFKGGRLIVGEFHKAYRDEKMCPTCLWRDSDVHLRQFIRGLVFDKLVAMERKAIRMENPPGLRTEILRHKNERMAQAVMSAVAVMAENISEEDARAAWELRREDFPEPPRAKVRRILVDTEDQAHDIVKRLEGGADFAALAERFSKDETTNYRGGETDFIGPGTLYGVGDEALKH